MIDNITRGHHAHNALENPALKQALDVMEREVIDAWEQCPARDADGKEYLWQLYKNVKKFRSILLGYVETGRLEKIKQDEEQSRLQTLRDNVTKFAKGAFR